jgi:hypothetical protein
MVRAGAVRASDRRRDGGLTLVSYFRRGTVARQGRNTMKSPLPPARFTASLSTPDSVPAITGVDHLKQHEDQC